MKVQHQRKGLFRLGGLTVAALAVLHILGTPAQAALDAATKALNRVVLIEGKIEDAETFGAGIILGRQGNRLYIVTANHVVRRGSNEAAELKVQFKFLPGELMSAQVLRDYDRDLDLAVLSVAGSFEEGEALEALAFDRLGDIKLLRRSDPVHAIGYPQKKPWHMSAAPEVFVDSVGSRLYFDSTALSKGYSGGAIFNGNWELLGMIRTDESLRAEAIAFDRLLELLGEWGYPIDFKTAAGISGTWEGSYGGKEITIEFKVLGNELFGTITEGNESRGILDGRLGGDRLSFHTTEMLTHKTGGGYFLQPGAQLPQRVPEQESVERVRILYRGTVTRNDIEIIRQSETGTPPATLFLRRPTAKGGRGWMGADFKVISADVARASGAQQVIYDTAIVTRVYDQGPAAKAGIELDDIIFEFNGVRESIGRRLASMVEETPAGSRVTLKIVRGGQPKELSVLLGEAPKKD